MIDAGGPAMKRTTILLACFLLAAAPRQLRCERMSPQILPISGLRTWLGRAGDRVSVRGVVTRTGDQVFMQDATGGVLVHFAEQPRIKVGDELEVTGSPQAMDYSARVENATGRVLWAGVPLPPVAITVGQAARGDFDSEYVEIEAKLDKVETRSNNVSVLYLSDEQQNFLAILPQANDGFTSPRFEPHSMVRLRGICTMSPSLTQNAVPFVLLLRSAEDAEELAGPPWWTPQLLFRDFLIFLCLSLLASLIYLRVRTGRVRAVQQEREHIAHEMHDTLAQSFAGVAFQLQAVRSRLPVEAEQLSTHVQVAIDMVRYSHQEARRSIAALRTRGVDHPPLADEILQSLERMVGDGPVRIQLVLNGSSHALPLRTANALLRIAQEAGANSLRHAEASTLIVRLIYLERAVMLELEDDGRGFDIEQPSLHGFGLSGMKLRARKLHGTLNIITAPGSGTTISAVIPLHEKSAWRRWRKA